MKTRMSAALQLSRSMPLDFSCNHYVASFFRRYHIDTANVVTPKK